MKYSIVIPCYNEEKNLPDLIDSLKSFPEKYNVQFILVENGSADGSRNYMKSIEDQVMPKIQFVWVDQNQGYGYGIQQGLKVAEGDYVGWIHADMQMNPHDLTKFFDYLESYGKEEKLFLKGYRRNRKMVEYAFSYGMGVFETLLFRTKMCEVMSMPFIVPAEMINNLDQRFGKIKSFIFKSGSFSSHWHNQMYFFHFIFRLPSFFVSQNLLS